MAAAAAAAGLSLRWLVHSACHVLGYEQHHRQSSSKLINMERQKDNDEEITYDFQMPLHYPRYSKADYENMEEWRLDLLLSQYGLSCNGSLHEKRDFAMGAFLWPDQY